MVIKYRNPKYITMDNRRYKVTGNTEGPIKMAIAEYRAITSKGKDFGWRTVKSLNTRTRLYDKIKKK